MVEHAVVRGHDIVKENIVVGVDKSNENAMLFD